MRKPKDKMDHLFGDYFHSKKMRHDGESMRLAAPHDIIREYRDVSFNDMPPVDVPAGLECPQKEELAAYLDNTLPGKAAVMFEKHVKQCSKCQKILSAGQAVLKEPMPQMPEDIDKETSANLKQIKEKATKKKKS